MSPAASEHMKKTITTTRTWCDDCQREIKDSPLSFSNFDICYTCAYQRIKHSGSIIPLGRQCDVCKGTGKIKEFYGYNNDHNWIVCTKCRGDKFIRLENMK